MVLKDTLYDQRPLESYRAVGQTILVALDGKDFFSSENISCPFCTQARQKDSSIRYRHIAVTPVIVAPGHDKVITLPPEYVTPQVDMPSRIANWLQRDPGWRSGVPITQREA